MIYRKLTSYIRYVNFINKCPFLNDNGKITKDKISGKEEKKERTTEEKLNY